MCAGELLVRGAQEPDVVRLGESLALVLAASALVHAVDQPGMLPGLDRDERGERDALAAAAGHCHHRGAAPAPGTSFRRPQALARFVFEDDPGVCVPITSSTLCDQPIFVDHATDLSLSSDAVQVEIDWLR